MENKKRLENYKCSQIRDFIEGRTTKLLIWGKPGRGKTYAMEYAMKELKIFLHKQSIANGYEIQDINRTYPMIMVKSADYCREMFRELEGFNGDENAFSKYGYREYLFFDDFGTENDVEKHQSYIYKLLDERKKPTMISMNLTMEQLSNRYDERILDRLAEYKFVEFTGSSWRKSNIVTEKATFE